MSISTPYLGPFVFGSLVADKLCRMITVAVLVMTIFHPGYCFPQMVSQAKKSKLAELERKDVSSDLNEQGMMSGQ